MAVADAVVIILVNASSLHLKFCDGGYLFLFLLFPSGHEVKVLLFDFVNYVQVFLSKLYLVFKTVDCFLQELFTFFIEIKVFEERREKHLAATSARI